MSHLPEPQWRGSNAASMLQPGWRDQLPTWAAHVPDPPARRRYLAWVLVCDTCGDECHNDGLDADYATYVPDAWHTNADGTHECPDCQHQQMYGLSAHEVARVLVDGLQHACPDCGHAGGIDHGADACADCAHPVVLERG